MFTTCSPHVHNMFTTCSPRFHQMFTTCSRHVHYIFIKCSQHVHYMLITFSSHVHHIFIRVNNMSLSKTHSKHVHNMFTTCSQNVHNVVTTCSLHVPLTKWVTHPSPQPPFTTQFLLVTAPKTLPTPLIGQATKNTFMGFPDLLPLNNLSYKCVEKPNRFLKTH